MRYRHRRSSALTTLLTLALAVVAISAVARPSVEGSRQTAAPHIAHTAATTPAAPFVDGRSWFNDAFPANDGTSPVATAAPGTAAFDTSAIYVKTGFNIEQPTGDATRPDIPGDSLVINSDGNTARVDMIFRILPGPGNYMTVGDATSGLRRRPDDPFNMAVSGVYTGDPVSDFWSAYLANPGEMSKGVHGNPGLQGPGGGANYWNPNVWNSARCDTAEMNLYALQGRGIPGGPPVATAWMSTYHESDPKYAVLGITKHKCFIVDPNGPLTDNNIVCDGTVPSYLPPGTDPFTRECTKIIPDGLLTPGSHVEYFFVASSTTSPGSPSSMAPDTNSVTQPTVQNVYGKRWEDFSALPNRWNDPLFLPPVGVPRGNGMACMLVVESDDYSGEPVWVGIADSIGATPQSDWGAHNGWHAIGNGNPDNPADNRRADGSVGFTVQHLGQGGSGGTWDQYRNKGAVYLDGGAGSLGGRLANQPTGAEFGKGSRQGPTPDMLRAYYHGILFLSGHHSSGVLGPYADHSQNEVALIKDFLTNPAPGAPTTARRFFWAIGDGFVQSNMAAGGGSPQQDLMLNDLGTTLTSPNYCQASGDNRSLVEFQTLVGAPGTRGMRNLCMNDVLAVAGIGLPTLGQVSSQYSGPGGYEPAGILKNLDPSAPVQDVTLVDGWDIANLTSAGDANTFARNNYFYAMFHNIVTPVTCEVEGPCPWVPVWSLTPAFGSYGSNVAISGTNLEGTTAVQFNGMNASAFTVNSNGSVTATVPSGATAGPVTVVTPCGAYSSTDPFYPTGWANCGVPVINAASAVTPASVSDGAGGMIVAWAEQRGADLDIYAQHMSPLGQPLWPAGDVALCTAVNNQTNPVILSDGAGGAIVAWQDLRKGTNTDIYAQRVNASGVVQWPTDGVALCAATGNQSQPTITADGSGGAVVAWNDTRSGFTIAAQRVSAAGAPQWATDGVALCSVNRTQQNSAIVSDGAGGAIVAWQDRGGTSWWNIYAQWVNSAGAPQWTANGVAVCNVAHETTSYVPAIVSDGIGGAVIGWSDFRPGAGGAYAQRLTAAGAARWTANGVALIPDYAVQANPVVAISNGARGAILSWTDNRSGTQAFAEKLDSLGVAAWGDTDGVQLCATTDGQNLSAMVSDGAGGAIVDWTDGRNRLGGGGFDIYAQRVNSSGVVQWAPNGDSLCTSPVDKFASFMVPDAAGGALVGWTSSGGIYAGRVSSNGGLITAAPAPSTEQVAPALAWPNPFNRQVTIAFSLQRATTVRMEVFDVAGRRVWASASQLMQPGRRDIAWDGRADDGAPEGGGIYFLRVRGPGIEASRAVVRVK